MISIFSRSYTQQVFRVKVKEYMPLFSAVVMPFVTPLVDVLFDRGVFLACVGDAYNQNQCKSSFLFNQGLEVPIKLTAVDQEQEDDSPCPVKLKIEVSDEHKIVIHSPKRVREIIRASAESAGHAWESIEKHVTLLVDKFYQGEFVFVETGRENADAFNVMFGYSDECNLNIRVKAAPPQKDEHVDH